MSETPETTREEMSPLRRSVVSGVKWGTVSAGAIFVLGLVQTATLAHLLTPTDFGLMAAAAVVIGLARSFADLGLSSAIVARQIRDRETLSSLYWASLIAGLAMFGIVLALMPLMVRFYREPELYHILPWAALSFVIIPIGQQFQMLLQMDLQVERLVKVDVASAVIALLVAVGAALAGAGPLALVFGYLARAGVTSLLFATGAGSTRGRRSGCAAAISTATSASACTRWASGRRISSPPTSTTCWSVATSAWTRSAPTRSRTSSS